MPYAYAHQVYDRLPDDIFDVKFDWDPTLVFFLFILICYTRALKKFKKPPVKKWQLFLFYTGMAMLILALLPPIDPLSDQLFWVHMVQHMLITHIGVPLMLFGVPFYILIRGVPNWFRRKVYFPLLRSRILSFLNRTVGRPIPSLILFIVNYWFWHLPRFYNLALLNDIFHFIEHASFAVTSILLWRNIIDPHPMKAHLPLPARLLFIGLIMASGMVLSAFLTFANQPWYAYEGIPQPSWFAHWGYVHDQRLGGLIMWIPGKFIHLLTMTIVFFVWARKEGAPDMQTASFLKKADDSADGSPVAT